MGYAYKALANCSVMGYAYKATCVKPLSQWGDPE